MSDEILLMLLVEKCALGRLGPLCAATKTPEGAVRDAAQCGSLAELAPADVDRLKTYLSQAR